MIKRKLKRILHCTRTLVQGGPFINYYTSHKNFGDQFNIDLMRFYAKSEICLVPKNIGLKHYLIVGSIAENATKHSVLLGVGLNQPHLALNKTTFGDVKIVRGEATRDIVYKKRSNLKQDIMLGDPGLLIAKLYGSQQQKVLHEFGVILHYADRSRDLEKFFEKIGAKIIRVDESPENVSNQILACRQILSSSLHGVIFSDALGVPNIRAIFSNKITGADFKFADYYSTTDLSGKDSIDFRCSLTKQKVDDGISKCRVAEYIYPIQELDSCVSRNLKRD